MKFTREHVGWVINQPAQVSTSSVSAYAAGTREEEELPSPAGWTFL